MAKKAEKDEFFFLRSNGKTGIVGVLGNDYQQLKTSVDFLSSRTMNSKVTTLSENLLKTLTLVLISGVDCLKGTILTSKGTLPLLFLISKV